MQHTTDVCLAGVLLGHMFLNVGHGHALVQCGSLCVVTLLHIAMINQATSAIRLLVQSDNNHFDSVKKPSPLDTLG